ncbi:MAG: toll/interleukin-1 receptor domain-containing protein [Erysipelotrichaceae bacterium]|nr:toll/interleukin-1 receptor domain-containing protein [Erysipelotrichaceae bacterium]
MSINQYQKKVNELDKEIAQLEDKKSKADKKAAEEAKKAASVNIPKNASSSTLKSKLKQAAYYEEKARKASKESAVIQKRIADKRKQRNDANKLLQKEQSKEDKKDKKTQSKKIADIQRLYEKRIRDLELNSIPERHLNENIYDNNIPEYDVFVSHAWEDKGSFVNEFVDDLRALGISVWYDTSDIKWGDSMRQKIDDGLKKSRFGVVVLSPDYIAEGKYWTKAELDGLFQLESVNGKILLPIWHGLTKQNVLDFSPILANKKAMSTAMMTAKEIALELKSLLDSINDN